MIPVIDVKETGNNIKRLMEKKGVVPTDIQLWCNLSSVQSVYHWVHGRSLPTIDNLLILSCMFDCMIEDILSYDIGLS